MTGVVDPSGSNSLTDLARIKLEHEAPLTCSSRPAARDHSCSKPKRKQCALSRSVLQ
jgi:hypothetical protein